MFCNSRYGKQASSATPFFFWYIHKSSLKLDVHLNDITYTTHLPNISGQKLASLFPISNKQTSPKSSPTYVSNPTIIHSFRNRSKRQKSRRRPRGGYLQWSFILGLLGYILDDSWAIFRLCQKNKSGLSSDVKESAKINRDNFYTNIFTITKTIQRENIIKGLRRTNKFAHTNLQNYTH